MRLCPGYLTEVDLHADLALEHGGGGGAALVLQPEGERGGDAVLQVGHREEGVNLHSPAQLTVVHTTVRTRSALMLAKGFPFTTTV